MILCWERLRKEVVPPGTIPFKGVRIVARTQEADYILIDLQKKYERGEVTNDDVHRIIEYLLKKGDVDIERDFANPTRSPFDSKSKDRWEKKTKNPLSGKGKSYADRVEGPDG